MQVWYQGEKSSFEGLNFEEITPLRSLDDENGTVYAPIHDVPTGRYVVSVRHVWGHILYRILNLQTYV